MHGRANVSSDSAHIGHLDGPISNVDSTSPSEVDPTVVRCLGSKTDEIRNAGDAHPHFIQYGNSSFELEDVHLNAELNKCSSPLKGNGCDSASPAISCSFPSQIPTPAYSDMFDRSHILSHKENGVNYSILHPLWVRPFIVWGPTPQLDVLVLFHVPLYVVESNCTAFHLVSLLLLPYP